MNSYLTDEEVDALQKSALHRNSPFTITGVSQGYFSASRHYGGCQYNGCQYVYQPLTDELIRKDVLKWVTERRKVESKKQVRKMEDLQQEMDMNA